MTRRSTSSETAAEAFAARHIPFEACFNFRDVGDYPTGASGVVRRGLLFRSGALHRMTPTDADHAGALGVASVLDLRRDDEVAADRTLGPLIERGARHHHLPIVPAGGSELLDARFGPGISGPRYVGYLELGGARFAEQSKRLGDRATYPAVVHCSAGKDRTGTLVAIVLSVLGVPRELIVRDYLLSNHDVERQVAWLAAAGRFDDDRDREGAGAQGMRDALAVPEGAIEHFLDHLDGAYGSVPDYLLAQGVTGRDLEAVRTLLTLQPDRA